MTRQLCTERVTRGGHTHTRRTNQWILVNRWPGRS